jgi:hypothetical protein
MILVGAFSESCSNWTSPVTLDSPRRTATWKIRRQRLNYTFFVAVGRVGGTRGSYLRKP